MPTVVGVLVDDPAASAGVLQRLRDQPEVVAGEGDVSGLDRGVSSRPAFSAECSTGLATIAALAGTARGEPR